MRTITKIPLLLLLIANGCKKDVQVTTAVVAEDVSNAENLIAQHFAFTFDNGPSDWRGEGDGTFYYVTNEGNPAPCINGVDQSVGIYWYFKAPDTMVKKITEKFVYNHSLKFDLKAPSIGETNEPDVILEADEHRLVYDIPQDPNGATWTTFIVPVNETAGWKKETLSGAPATKAELRWMQKNLKKLLIRGEFYVGGDSGYLDNVTFE